MSYNQKYIMEGQLLIGGRLGEPSLGVPEGDTVISDELKLPSSDARFPPSSPRRGANFKVHQGKRKLWVSGGARSVGTPCERPR
jgi:hypothetical protein